jgi:hypothetical protein
MQPSSMFPNNMQEAYFTAEPFTIGLPAMLSNNLHGFCKLVPTTREEVLT